MKKGIMALCFIASCWGISCSSSRKQAAGLETTDSRFSGMVPTPASSGRISSSVQAAPPVVIYKTAKDYSRHVPVGLSEDGQTIVSYPAVSDVKVGDKYPYPTPLADGYLLDNRGIGRNVAFLSYTYEEYAALPSTPSRSELLEKVIDKHPLTEIHTCGNRYEYKDLVKELNERIRSGEFKVSL